MFINNYIPTVKETSRKLHQPPWRPHPHHFHLRLGHMESPNSQTTSPIWPKISSVFPAEKKGNWPPATRMARCHKQMLVVQTVTCKCFGQRRKNGDKKINDLFLPRILGIYAFMIPKRHPGMLSLHFSVHVSLTGHLTRRQVLQGAGTRNQVTMNGCW